MDTLDYLKFHRKLNMLLAMPLYMHPINILRRNSERLLMPLYQAFTEIIVALVTVGQFCAVPHIYEDMNVLCGCLSSAFHCAQILLKTLLLNIYKKPYLAHLDKSFALQHEITESFESLCSQNHSKSFAEFHKKNSRYIKIITITHFIVNFISTFAYFFPFVYDSIANRHELSRQQTPIVVYLGIDFKFTPLFQIVVLTLSVGFLIVNLKCVVVDSFILSTIIFHMCQLTYHNHILTEIKGNINKNALESDKAMVASWIRQHQVLLSLYNELRKFISPYLFIEFAYILIHTCMPAFVITSTFSWTPPQKVSVFFMVGGSIVSFFLMSNAGDSFCEAWEKTSSILFDADIIPKHGTWLKHAYLIIQKRLNKPFYFSALNIVPLNCSTFIMIIRLIISYYVTLSQIQKMKHNV